MKSVLHSFTGILVAYWYEPIVEYSSRRLLYNIIYNIWLQLTQKFPFWRYAYNYKVTS